MTWSRLGKVGEEARTDRSALARLLGNRGKFAYGRVEVETDDAEDLLRGLTELRLAIRVASLAEVPAILGAVSLPWRKKLVEGASFAYLILAECGKLNRRSRLA